MRQPLSFLALVAAFVVVPAAARAQSDSETRALQLFEESAERYRQGRFKEAVELLEEAYRLKPEAVLLYNLGRAYEGLGDAERALDAYTRYLAADPETRDRGAIETRIATLKRQLDERKALEKERSAPADEPERKPSALPWVVAGIGAAGIGAGVVLGVLSNAREDEASAPETSARDTPAKLDAASTFATGANVAFIAGGAVCLAGVVWGIVDVIGSGSSEPPKKTSAVSLTVTPTWIGARGRF